MLVINVLTLFPSFFESPFKAGILGRALQKNVLKVNLLNPRDFTQDVHQKVDDSPFGGGDGMLMQYLPLKKTLNSITRQKPKQKVFYLSPQGKMWNFKKARLLSQEQELTFLCGRYSGVDQRFLTEFVDEEVSIGNYVLTGGEVALLVIMESIVRFLEGGLGNAQSVQKDSFEYLNLLEAPQWTHPRQLPGFKIPEVMFSGHHKNIKEFLYYLSVLTTAIKRPDLLISNEKVKKDFLSAIKMSEKLTKEELRACGLKHEDLKRAYHLLFNKR